MTLAVSTKRVFLLKVAALKAVSEALFDEYGKLNPKNREAHVQVVLESILRAQFAHPDRSIEATIAHFELCAEKMRAALGRPLFAPDWRAAYLYADVEA